MEAGTAGTGSAVNAPHPDDTDPPAPAVDPDDFFGESEEPAETPPEPEPEPESDPEPDPEPEAAAPSAPAAGGEPAAPPAEPPAEEEGGKSATRDYVVIRELDLTPEVLEALLKEAKESGEPSYRKAYFVLDMIETRGAKHALREAFGKHRARLGDAARLVTVTANSWKVRTVKPRTREVASLDID